MNTLSITVLFIVAITATNAEAPLRPRFQRIQQSPPYPPSGYRPNQPFTLPQRQTAPKPVYGVPEKVLTTTENDLTTTVETTTVEVPLEPRQNLKDREELADNVDMGVYYIYHPTGLLQRINYATKNDLKNMAYRAEFKYQDVEPIVDPIYTYDPDTYVLRQVLV
ncbi:hypothetical protein AMK59_668 [Oryctes borbonicus]|uniref:DUF4794 domain-containing protein n=1 Tax=Oryctes borbonicus TaxID=1629725 RepID=A0A0T6BA15_9SCAR|nr:hypothetical protein AMK59_668 [Oryctes borbonicus]